MRIYVRESLPSPLLPMSSARQGIANSGTGAQTERQNGKSFCDDGAHPSLTLGLGLRNAKL
jgi:hypothetical protein